MSMINGVNMEDGGKACGDISHRFGPEEEVLYQSPTGLLLRFTTSGPPV